MEIPLEFQGFPSNVARPSRACQTARQSGARDPERIDRERSLSEQVGDTFGAFAENVFLIKASYWIGW